MRYYGIRDFDPTGKLFSGEVYGVQLPGISGSFEILDKHAPLVSALGKGNVKVLEISKATMQRPTLLKVDSLKC